MIYPKLGYDIDGVLAEFSDHFLNYFPEIEDKSPATDWNDPRFRDNFPRVQGDYHFWSNIPVLEGPEKLSIKPHCYITSRDIPNEWSMEWLWRNGFPYAKLVTVGMGQSKVRAATELQCTHFVDDHIKNFRELNQNGVKCYLRTRSHNVKEDTDLRVDSINELFHEIIAKSNYY